MTRQCTAWTPIDSPREENGLHGARPFYTPQHATHLIASRNAVKTARVSERGIPPERAQPVSKGRENRRPGSQEQGQEPIAMGSWLFSSNPCNCSSCELGTHPGAHRLVYVRRPNELNAFRNAMKSAAEPFHSGNHTQAELPESAVFVQSRPAVSRVGQLFPESASCFQSRPFLERVGRRSLTRSVRCGLLNGDLERAGAP